MRDLWGRMTTEQRQYTIIAAVVGFIIGALTASGFNPW